MEIYNNELIKNTGLVLSEEELKKRFEELPYIVQSKTTDLENLANKVDEAQNAAERAKYDSDNLKGFVEKSLMGIKYKSGDPKIILEETQNVVKLMASAIEDQAEAQTLSFKFQQRLARATEDLFILGCGNIAQNEAMIMHLEETIKNLGKNPNNPKYNSFRDKVKEQYASVIQRLFAQREILASIEKYKIEIKNIKQENSSLFQEVNIVKGEISTLKSEIGKKDEEIKKNHEIIDKLFSEKKLLFLSSIILAIAAIVVSIIALCQ